MKAVAGWVEEKLKLGCDDTKCLVELGCAMGTDLIVAGSLSNVGGTYTISLRLINTRGKDAGVLSRVSETCTSEKELVATAAKVASKLAGGQ